MSAILISLLVIVIIFLFFSFPSVNTPKQLKNLEGKYFAHRGLHDIEKGIPENSLTSFLLAVEKEFGIENDVRLTKDLQVVVFHDDNLKRLCGEDVKVSNLTLKQLKKYKLSGTHEQIPTLKECLDAVDGKVPILIEIKYSKINAKKEYEIISDILKDYKGEFYVQSFFPQIIYYCRKLTPHIVRGQLASAYYNSDIKGKIFGALLMNFISRPHFISYDHKYPNNIFLRISKLLGAFPVCWTVRSKEQLEKAKKTFKAFIFENFIP